MPPLSESKALARFALLLALALAAAVPVAAAEPGEQSQGEPGEEQGTEGDAAESEGGSPASSLTQTLQADAGVSVQTLCTNCNNADLSLGGLGNEHVAVTCDGLPVPAGLAQIYLLSIVPSTVIDKVAVRKGAGDVELEGGAVGGGIEIERRRPKPGFQLNASADDGEFGWRAERVDLSGQRGRFGGSFVASRAQSDAIPESHGFANLPSFDRDTLDGSVFVKVGRSGRLRFGAADYDESQKDGKAAAAIGFQAGQPVLRGYDRENVELNRRQYDAAYETSFLGGSTVTVAALSAKRSQDIEETQNLSTQFRPAYFIDESRRHTAAAWSRPLGQRAALRAGASTRQSQYDFIDVFYNGMHGLPPDTEFQETVDEQGIWMEGETALGGELALSAGVRWADFSYEDGETRPGWSELSLPEGNRFLPRAALTWKPVDPLQLRFSAGTGFRAPEPILEEVCCGRLYRNNRGLDAERSQSYGIEVTYQPQPRFRLSGSGFLTDFDEQVIKMATLAFQFRPTYQHVNVPEARHASLSVETRYDATSWLGLKASASWLDAENRSDDDAIPVLVDTGGSPVARVFHSERIPYTAQRRGSAGIEVHPPRWGVTFGVATQYTGPTLIQRYDPDFPDPQTASDAIDFVWAEEYWVLNVNASKSFKNGLALYAGVDNINDYVQPDLGDPHFDYNWGPLRGRYAYGGLSYRFEK